MAQAIPGMLIVNMERRHLLSECEEMGAKNMNSCMIGIKIGMKKSLKTIYIHGENDIETLIRWL